MPEATKGLVALAFELHERPAVTDPALPPTRLHQRLIDGLAALVGAEQVRTDDDVRRLRTRGKSTPDLLRARAGDLGDAPDVVVCPADHSEVVAVLGYAARHWIAVVPFGGGTCVTGGLTADGAGFAGVISLDLGRLNRLLEVDEISRTVTLEPGLRGPEAEALLAEHGLTLGHFPQSFEFASIGGFAATRSSGQSSAGYGRFDSMVVGLTLATPTGTLTLDSAPASAAGPDLRQLVLGSEGAFGVITSLKLRARPIPETNEYEGWRWASFSAGAEAMRRLAQDQLLPTVLRLSDEAETAVNLASPEAIGSDAATGSMMLVGYEGTPARVARDRTAVTELLTSLGGTPLGAGPGAAWAEGRFEAPYLRDSLLDVGVLVETLETATFWSRVDAVYSGVKSALESHLESALVLCHISHVYETGCSLYFTVAAQAKTNPIPQWLPAKAAASDAMLAAGATITHHHAVGRDHLPWLAREIGPVGVAMLRGVKERVDPEGICNPGVLIP